jgi:DNA-binding MarR family transcriptional regulator
MKLSFRGPSQFGGDLAGANYMLTATKCTPADFAYHWRVRNGANLKAVEHAMTEIRRRQGRRSLRERADLQAWGRDDLSLLPALEVIEEEAGKATVGAVAALSGLDLSRASRAVSAAVKAGYVMRVASQADGRSTFLRLSKEGERFTRFAHKYRQARINEALDGWSQRDCDQLARLMTRFTDALRREEINRGANTPT